MDQSLCGNSYGCLPEHGDHTAGSEFSIGGTIVPCWRCQSIALTIVELMVGEAVEYVAALCEWVQSSQVQDRLKTLLLYQALQPELQKYERLCHSTHF
jgi:hypothetical protein